MTVAEFKKILDQLPGDMEIEIDGYGSEVNEVYVNADVLVVETN